MQFEKGTVQDYFNSMIAKIGENLILNDLLIKENKNSNYSFYIHNSYRKNIGKIISIIEYSTNENNTEIETLSKNLCMHSGKPSNIVEKILEGKMKKYFSEVTLLNQSYILDQDKTVRDIINQHSKYEFNLISFDLINL